MTKSRLMFTLPAACLLVTAAAQADTIHFREGGGSGYTDVTFDDTYIVYNPADDTTHGNQDYDGIQCSSSKVTLIAIKDMFTELPISSGGQSIQIQSATLHLFRYNSGSSSNIVSIYPITTNWLPDPAGSNENDVSGMHAEKSSTTDWASGDWSSSDYDGSVCDTGNWVDGYNEKCELDITDVIAEIYSDGTNYGMVLYADGTINGRASEHSTYRPTLEITYTYSGTLHTLTVNSGSGDGDYTESTVVDITADTAPSGKEFDEWVGDTSGIADVSDPTTTLTMPPANQEVTATYTDATYYTLTVNSGTGDGNYISGTVVDIDADTAPSGKQFDEWVGDTEGIANVNAASTTLTMPPNNAEVTATYTDITGPYITGASGNVVHGNSITISGGNFGSKSQAAPYKYDDFEDGSLGETIGDGWYTWSNISGKEPIYSDAQTRASGIAEQTAYLQHDVAYNSTLGVTGLNWGYDHEAYLSCWYYCTTAGAESRNFKILAFRGGAAGDWDGPDIRADMYPNTDSGHAYVADCSKALIAQDWSLGGNLMENGWHRVELWAHMGTSSSSDNDGICNGWRDLSSWWVIEDFEYDFSTQDFDNIYFAAYFATDEGTPTPQMWWYWDEIYIDTTQSRVEMGDASTWNGCTHREIQIPSSWSGDSITATVNRGSFSTGTAYLYVVDSDGNVSPGYEVTISGGPTYTLTVNSGTGDGSYTENTIVDIDADTAPSGKEFDEWVGDTSGIASVTSSSTTLTMPAANQEVTATYTDLPTYTLTVNSGTGDGSYTEDTIVDIDADTAPSGKEFDEWVGDTGGIASVTSASTTLTMPAANQEITATYADSGPTGDVATDETAVKGTVSGDYTDTHTSNDVYESITERESGGKPSNRYSYLEHQWTFNVTGGSTVTFYIEAYKTDNSEGDDFVFAYSTNGEDWTNMVTVTKTSDDDSTQSYALPSSLSGTTYVRVKDTDQTAGNKSLDTIYVDHMYIRSE